MGSAECQMAIVMQRFPCIKVTSNQIISRRSEKYYSGARVVLPVYGSPLVCGAVLIFCSNVPRSADHTLTMPSLPPVMSIIAWPPLAVSRMPVAIAVTPPTCLAFTSHRGLPIEASFLGGTVKRRPASHSMLLSHNSDLHTGPALMPSCVLTHSDRAHMGIKIALAICSVRMGKYCFLHTAPPIYL